MLYPPVADLLKNMESRYLLVNVVAHRARQIAAEAEAFQEELTDKPVTLAIREAAEGKLIGSVKDRGGALWLRKLLYPRRILPSTSLIPT